MHAFRMIAMMVGVNYMGDRFVGDFGDYFQQKRHNIRLCIVDNNPYFGDKKDHDHQKQHKDENRVGAHAFSLEGPRNLSR